MYCDNFSENERDDFIDIVSKIKNGNYFVDLAILNGEVIGGMTYRHLPKTSLGFLEFVVVSDKVRGLGVASSLHLSMKNHLTSLCIENGRKLSGLIADADFRDPLNSKIPFFAKLNYKIVPFYYLQPPLGNNKTTIDHNTLLFSPIELRLLTKPFFKIVLEEIFTESFGMSLDNEYWRLTTNTLYKTPFNLILSPIDIQNQTKKAA
jgi:hypothetical protein